MKFLLSFISSLEDLEQYTEKTYPQDKWVGLLRDYCSSEMANIANNECAKNCMCFFWNNFIIPLKEINNASELNASELSDFLMEVDNKTKKSYLHLLAEGGYDIFIDKILSYLCEEKHDVKIDQMAQNKTALFLATEKKYPQTVAVLLKFKADMEKNNFSQVYMTAVHQAAKNNDISCLKIFFHHNKRCFHIYDKRGYSPFHEAMLANSLDVVKWMRAIENDILLQRTVENTQFVLHLLASKKINNEEMIRYFCEQCPNVINYKTAAGDTALHLAIKNTAYYNVKALLNIGVDITIEDTQGNIPLFLTIFSLEKNLGNKQSITDNIDILKLLLSNENITLSNSKEKSVDVYISSDRFSDVIEQVWKQDEIDSKKKQPPEPTIIELLEDKRNKINISNNNIDNENIPVASIK